GAAELLADLEAIETSLRRHRGEHAGAFAVRRLIRRVHTFGFHLATLDVRQDSAVHDSALAELLGDAQWETREAPARLQRLAAQLSKPQTAQPEAWSADTSRTLEVFRTLAKVRTCFGEEAIGPYIISMSRS